MNIFKFLKSFNTVDFYLVIASLMLAALIFLFYFVSPN
ncbi:hypothetical protein EC846_0721 [Acinetobacter sp. BIGb0102]|jgi:hypothetical protein|uniref:Uncharacterized protein n=1 Tax=Acinetobacter vivianii TaxID=1776742 RepID=N8UW89_9GAMM|nr:hypothetical protein F971_02767 [Acinetobacter vivianii]ENX22705.1 hypothetical protein F892_01947 [Acinetobacter vivianii]RPE31259.1 hypothetical protein EC846_0721 [Acinetobacter sp. BIGb0102]